VCNQIIRSILKSRHIENKTRRRTNKIDNIIHSQSTDERLSRVEATYRVFVWAREAAAKISRGDDDDDAQNDTKQ